MRRSYLYKPQRKDVAEHKEQARCVSGKASKSLGRFTEEQNRRREARSQIMMAI